MDEGRKASRHRVLKAGTISFGGAGITCTVRNLSDTEAALDVTSPIGISVAIPELTQPRSMLFFQMVNFVRERFSSTCDSCSRR